MLTSWRIEITGGSKQPRCLLPQKSAGNGGGGGRLPLHEQLQDFSRGPHIPVNRLYELSDYPAIEAVIHPRPEPWPSGWAAVCYDDELA